MDLDIIGTPFEGHSKTVRGLALSFDGALLPSASDNQTIKLWAFESRQRLASFHVLNPNILVFSSNTYQVAYTTRYCDDHKIYICNTVPDILVSNGLAPNSLATVRIRGIRYCPCAHRFFFHFCNRPSQSRSCNQNVLDPRLGSLIMSIFNYYYFQLDTSLTVHPVRHNLIHRTT